MDMLIFTNIMKDEKHMGEEDIYLEFYSTWRSRNNGAQIFQSESIFDKTNKTFLPNSRKVLSTFPYKKFRTYCLDGVQVAQTKVHFPHFQVQPRKRGVLGWGWGCLGTCISAKGVCDGRVKNRGGGWYSGQNETLSGQGKTPCGQYI